MGKSKTDQCGKVNQGIPGTVGNLGGQPVKQSVRPNRSKPRTYSAADAGRIICYAVGSGATPSEIQEKAGCCLGDLCERERQLIRRLLIAGAVVGFALSLAIPWLRLLRTILALPGIGGLVSRLIPSRAAALLADESAVIDLAVSEWRVIMAEAEKIVSSTIP
jgi:hypothetical protein